MILIAVLVSMIVLAFLLATLAHLSAPKRTHPRQIVSYGSMKRSRFARAVGARMRIVDL